MIGALLAIGSADPALTPLTIARSVQHKVTSWVSLQCVLAQKVSFKSALSACSVIQIALRALTQLISIALCAIPRPICSVVDSA